MLAKLVGIRRSNVPLAGVLLDALSALADPAR